MTITLKNCIKKGFNGKNVCFMKKIACSYSRLQLMRWKWGVWLKRVHPIMVYFAVFKNNAKGDDFML